MPPTPSNRAGRAPEGTFHRTWGAPPQHSVSAQRPPHAIPTSGVYAPSGAARATPPRAPIRQHHAAHARRPPRAGRHVGAACDASWARRGGARSSRHGQHTPCQLATYTHTCSMTLRRPESQRKAGSTLGSSRAVPHPSTNRALRRLTSEVRRDPVHSTRYGRQRKTSGRSVLIDASCHPAAIHSGSRCRCSPHSSRPRALPGWRRTAPGKGRATG